MQSGLDGSLWGPDRPRRIPHLTDQSNTQLFTAINAITIVCALLTATSVLLSLIYMRERTRACVRWLLYGF